MKVVVTGATGFMGSRLCAALAGDGHDVRAFTLPGVDVSGVHANPGVEVVYGDVTDEESLVVAFQGRDAVFHAAAVVEAWLPDPSVFHAGVRYLRHQWAYSCEKAKRVLGYSPRSLHEDLTETLLWLQEDQRIKF